MNCLSNKSKLGAVIDAKTSLLPLQILAGQPGLSSIRGIGDVVSILSGIGTNPETFGALAKLKGVELEKTKQEVDAKSEEGKQPFDKLVDEMYQEPDNEHNV